MPDDIDRSPEASYLLTGAGGAITDAASARFEKAFPRLRAL
jgi:hypothetical protein